MMVHGDLRFLSHRDMMRVAERTALRASIPLQYSQGFNPHPILSLPCPRPVGVASLDDLLVIRLDDSDPPQGPVLCERLNRSAPQGLSFDRAETIDTKASIEPTQLSYRLELPDPRDNELSHRLDHLADMDQWLIQRRKKAKGRNPRNRPKSIEIDIKPHLPRILLQENSLEFDLVAHNGRWAKPQEVLRILELDESLDLARLRRVRSRFAFQD
jgi:radical SAM-linked protein